MTGSVNAVQVAQPPDVRSFYALPDGKLCSAVCQGAACFAARRQNPQRWKTATERSPRVYCLGRCYAAPASTEDEERRPKIAAVVRTPIVLERIVRGGAASLDEYARHGGLEGLEAALRIGSLASIARIEAAELSGRGGAGYPTGLKWRAVRDQASPEKYVVANLDEGDPGAYIDRFIGEDDPYCLLEGMAIAAHAVGARRGYIYVRCEYPRAVARLSQALLGARRGGLLGRRVLDADFAFDVELVVGQGSYQCGEETSLLNSIAGRRPTARTRPPYVAQIGLNRRPTLVNNVETLANIPWIMRHGEKEFAARGLPGSRGTKVVSLNSLFRNPGLYEVEFGLPLREIVEDIGGGVNHGKLTALMIGGPLAGVIPPSLLETKFGFRELADIGAAVGHGGVIAFDEHTTIPQLVLHVFSFGAYESCGLCTPCRLGAPRIEQMLRAASNRSSTQPAAQQEWSEIVQALKSASLCGLGSGLADFARSIERHFGGELDRCFA